MELFDRKEFGRKWEHQALEDIDRPILIAHGNGVDSMAMCIQLRDHGVKPDAILHADVGSEKDETYRYLPVLRKWLKRAGWPDLVIVKYVPKRFKNYPPYATIEENCLSNGTLPSLAFGFKSCSLKWKASPQDAWTKGWGPALDTWSKGQRVVKLIGFDDSKGDQRRCNHAGNADDPQYEYRYPLQEWHITRTLCVQTIVDEGLPGWDPRYIELMPVVVEAWKSLVIDRTPAARKAFIKASKELRKALRWIKRGGVPMKSSCFFCPAMKIPEIVLLPKAMLQRIVMMEARAKPRLQNVVGLWRTPTKMRPGAITDFIRHAGLLSDSEIARLQDSVPKHLRRNVDRFRDGMPVETWDEFFNEVGVDYCS